MQVLAIVLIGLGLAFAGACFGAFVGFRAGRQEGATVSSEQQIVDADAFTEQLHAVPVEHEPSPVAPSSLRLERPPPIPSGVWGMPLGHRQPLVAQAFVGSGGKRSRPDGVEPSPVLAIAIGRYKPEDGPFTVEFNRMTADWEVEHVA